MIDAAPLFEERLRHEFRRDKAQATDCRMCDVRFDGSDHNHGHWTFTLSAVLYPEQPAHWKRQFPVIGAVAGVAGTIAAVEAIKVIAGVGQPLWGRLLSINLKSMQFRQLSLERNLECAICSQFST